MLIETFPNEREFKGASTIRLFILIRRGFHPNPGQNSAFEMVL
jgi:hypothetical protein